jgi:uncharacterized coiled-coil protein SlyX
MRKTLQLALAAAVLLFAGATTYLYTQYQKTQSSLVTAQQSDQASRDQYTQAIDAIAEIQDSLNAIAPESKMPGASQSLQGEKDMGGPNRGDVLNRIATLRTSLARNKERITKLESALRHSGMRISGLSKLVANLKATSEEKERQITELAATVTGLQTQVSGLTTQVEETQTTLQQREETLAQKQTELATVYYVEGTKRALTKSGVIVTKGGVLGIGKTIKPAGNISDNVFQTINTDQVTIVPLSSAKAQVVSAQPVSSYELKLVDGKMELHILDAEQFRKVRQLVIVTA